MYGTVLICTQNLAVSGANQVLVNIVNGGFFEGVVVVLSPSAGPLQGPLQEAGCAVRVGSLDGTLSRLRDVRLVLCNTVMTAPQVIELARRKIPHMWILHEWWPDDDGTLKKELAARNISWMTEDTVKEALTVCTRCVCVCQAQAKIYPIKCPQTTVYVGVPGGAGDLEDLEAGATRTPGVTTFLCIGIVCPRKNQHATVRIFKKFAKDRQDVKLIVVGARYIRDFEIEYVEKVKQEMAGDPRIELHDVTPEPSSYYKRADVLLFNSVNEVTPLVLPEAMLHHVPVITTNIAGIPEMLKHGEHGFVLDPEDDEGFISAMTKMVDDPVLRHQMAEAGMIHASNNFTLDKMVENYATVARELAPVVVLLDMDGTVVDWDAGFRKAWGDKPLDRSKSYAMEDCVPADMKEEAMKVFMAPGFFRNLLAFPYAVEAVKEMEAAGFQVWFCTSPILGHATCCQEKLEWIQEHFGDGYVKRVILCQDKTTVRGDILVDDKPRITGMHNSTWQQCLFDAPYNKDRTDLPRVCDWKDWEGPLRSVLERTGMKHVPSKVSQFDMAGTSEDASEESNGPDLKTYVAGLRDFSDELKAMGVYLSDYSSWRKGKAKGAKGEALDVLRNAKDAYLRDAIMNDADEPEDIFMMRQNYATWRRSRLRPAARGSLASQATMQSKTSFAPKSRIDSVASMNSLAANSESSSNIAAKLQQVEPEVALNTVKQVLKLKKTDRLEIVSVAAGAWAAVFVELMKRKYVGFEDQVRIRVWRRPGKKLSAKQAADLLKHINKEPETLKRLRDSGQLLRYVDTSLGRDIEPPLTADEALSDGFCDTLAGATLMPMEVVKDIEEAALQADILINGVPSTNTLDVWAPLAEIFKKRKKEPPVVISLAKGVDFVTDPTPHVLTPTRLIHRCTGIPLERLLYFGGPNIAIELFNGNYATARLCGPLDELRGPLANMLSQPLLSVWHNRDVITHEVMGGLKNVYAIAAGIVDEACHRNATANSVLFSNLCAEMTFITHVLSRRPEVLSGPLLADTYVTMLAGRNAWYGRQLASGALSPSDGDIVPGKGHIQGVSAVQAFASLLACTAVPLGQGGAKCPAIEFLPMLKTLNALLFGGTSVQEFLNQMRTESVRDPSEQLLSRAVRNGAAFVPNLLQADASNEVSNSGGGNDLVIGSTKLPEPFLSDDKLAAMGICVESMDKFRSDYLKFRAGVASGAKGEAVAATIMK